MSKKSKAVIVGGSIGGLSCSHALISAGWDVLVLEKSTSPPTGTPTGAGLGLEPLVQTLVQSWLPQPRLLHHTTSPLTIDQNQAVDGERKERRIITRDEDLNFRAAHWVDLHGLLYYSLPPHIFLWGHHFLSFSIADDKTSVNIKATVLRTDQIVDFSAKLLVAADGSLSSIRKAFLPNYKLRYSGYCAWRGVFDFSEHDKPETISKIRKAYPDLGKCLYFELGYKTHTVLYELLNKKINWIWYVNQPEPQLKGNSVTMKVSSEMVQKMQKEAEKTWAAEFVTVIKETRSPFLNVIYDGDPLEQLVWDSVVLVGEAAHPTTPHGLRSTNMSIIDAAVLGKCLEKWGSENVGPALLEYQSIRLPVVRDQVLHARRMGLIKQGLDTPDGEHFDPRRGNVENKDRQELKQRSMPFFADIPALLE